MEGTGLNVATVLARGRDSDIDNLTKHYMKANHNMWVDDTRVRLKKQWIDQNPFEAAKLINKELPKANKPDQIWGLTNKHMKEIMEKVDDAKLDTIDSNWKAARLPYKDLDKLANSRLAKLDDDAIAKLSPKKQELAKMAKTAKTVVGGNAYMTSDLIKNTRGVLFANNRAVAMLQLNAAATPSGRKALRLATKGGLIGGAVVAGVGFAQYVGNKYLSNNKLPDMFIYT